MASWASLLGSTLNVMETVCKVDSISSEVGQISNTLRGYLEHGIASGRKVQPPRTKSGRDLLAQVLAHLDLVSAQLNEIRDHASVHTWNSPSPPTVQRLDTSLPSEAGAISQQTRTQPPPAPQRAEVEYQKPQIESSASNDCTTLPASQAEPNPALTPPISTAPSAIQDCSVPYQTSHGITLRDGSVYHRPIPSEHASPLFDCTYQDIHVLNEELFELYSSHPRVRDLGYFKLQVRGLPELNAPKVARPSKDHATSFTYKTDRLGLVKVDSGKKFKFKPPTLPFPMSAKIDWSLAEQRDLWNSSAADPPKGNREYIIGNPLFDDVELSPGDKLRRRGRAKLEGINTQYVYFNLTGKTITTMHREDAHVRSENLLRSGEHKFWCFVKPAFSKKLEKRMAMEYHEMRQCSQAVRHLSRNIPPAKLDEWGIEYTLDYCTPGQAIVTEPGTYHQVLNLGPNYAIAINVEYNSSPDMPPDYQFCDDRCPDKNAIKADDIRIYDESPQPIEDQLPRTPETTGSQQGDATVAIQQDAVARMQPAPTASQPTQPVTPPPEQAGLDSKQPGEPQPHIPQHPCAQSSILSPEHSVPSTSDPSEQPDRPPRELTSAEVLAPLETHFTSLRPPTLQPSPSQVEPGAAAPIHPPVPPMQAPNFVPNAFAYSAQILPQAAPSTQRDIGSSFARSRVMELPPLRKTARMINPDRDYEPSSPRPLKKQRVEYSPALTAPDSPVRSAFKHLSILLRGRQTARPVSLVAEMLCGKPAFDRLAHLVRDWRRYSKSAPSVMGKFQLANTIEETARGYPELHMFLSRFFKMKVAMCLEISMARRVELTPEHYMDGLLQLLKWDETKRPKLYDDLREGKCWAKICGDYDGLLCLIPPESDCLDLALFRDEVARLHVELDNDFVRRLCAVGAILQRSIWDCLELPEFIWESMITTLLPVDRVAPLLAPFRLLRSNYYDPNSGYYWPRPAGWDWQWPADPSMVKPGDKACSFCSRKKCRCAEIKVPQIPRISDDGSRGPGVRSVGLHRTNDILGELVGELVPLGSCAADWTMALHRPDLDDEPVADIYPRRMGNWVRKVSHNTNPSAMFRVIKISGRWRQMLVAIRDIGDGEEITAKYGKGYLKEQPYSVVEGLH
ncbi:hypothetical protein N657DRAFT_655196 [Parathielavia appendiculata]|uniref:JmjC domain-containing protein n=1 Tax=Parathielavia appendiculata TaxID=2587402 RepID=A0AAN6Z4N1_9PEZI|nr:hypothetical protein N657DRAFT_655196 [Parathielavia appendiculata]